MLEYDRIDISEGTDINNFEETSTRCSLWNYRVNFAFISKKDAYNLIRNATIIDKKGNIIK